MNDIAIAKLLRATKKLAKVNEVEDNNLLYGIIKKVNPIEIELQQGLIINDKHIILGEALRPHNVSMPHIHEYNGETEDTGGQMVMGTNFVSVSVTGQATVTNVSDKHNHKIKEQNTEDVHKTQNKNEKYVTITMYPPLGESDIVMLFSMNRGQMYYVAERVKIGDKHTNYDT